MFLLWFEPNSHDTVVFCALMHALYSWSSLKAHSVTDSRVESHLGVIKSNAQNVTQQYSALRVFCVETELVLQKLSDATLWFELVHLFAHVWIVYSRNCRCCYSCEWELTLHKLVFVQHWILPSIAAGTYFEQRGLINKTGGGGWGGWLVMWQEWCESLWSKSATFVINV